MVAARLHGCVLFCFNFLDNKILLLAYKLISVHGFFFLKNVFAEFYGLCHLES